MFRVFDTVILAPSPAGMRLTGPQMLAVMKVAQQGASPVQATRRSTPATTRRETAAPKPHVVGTRAR